MKLQKKVEHHNEREIYAVEEGLVTVLDVQAMAERLIRNAG